ncbi:MAG: class I SAM-dependent methyltransferase [Alphaproteobacteria bacterium]|nr:class I SAM-dependent methyltransferase [Alphaproteobacteria bacterium]
MTACLLCGADHWDVVEPVVRDNRFASPGEWRVRACKSCGLWQTDPLPTDAQLIELYERHYNFGGEGETGSTWAKLRAAFFASPLYRLLLAVDGDVSFHTLRGAGRLLDVGCNEGRGLEIYAGNGFEAEGLELNRVAADAARNKGFVVYGVPIEELQPRAPYDVVVLSNVLEHALDPRAMLAAIRRHLAPGGRLCLSLPNAASALRARFGKDWINWHVPFHITHFSAERLSALLAESGFSVAAVRNVSPALWYAQSCIAAQFPDEPRRQRDPKRVIPLMLWALTGLAARRAAWNRSGRGDCLVIEATRA